MRANDKKVLGFSVLGTLLATAGCGGHGNGSTPGSFVAPVVSGTGKQAIVGSLVEGRDGAIAALVGTGSVLVAGGRTSAGDATDTAEMIHGETGVSAPVLARMTTARTGARAVRLEDGRILILGGSDEKHHALTTSEVFDPANGTFLRGPALARAHVNAPFAVSGTTLYLAGGEGETSVETIDLATLTPGKTLGKLARSHAGGHAVAAGNQLIVGGGEDEPEVMDAKGNAHSLWNPEGNARFAALVPVSDGALLVGGTNTWTLRPRTSEIRGSLASAVETRGRGSVRVQGIAIAFAKGQLILGGRLDLNAPLQSATDILYPSGDTGVGPTLRTPRVDGEAVSLEDGRVLLVGGKNLEGQLVPEIEMLIPPGGRTPDAAVAFAARAQVFVDRNSEQAGRILAEGERDQLQAEDTRLTGELAQTTTERDQFLAQRDAEHAARVADEAQIVTLTKLYDDTLVQLHDEQAKLQQAQGDLATARAAVVSLTAQLQAANQTIAANNTRIAALQQNVADAQAKVAAANAQISQLNGQLGSLQNQVNTLQAQNAGLQGQVTSLATRSTPVTLGTPVSKTLLAPGPLVQFGDSYTNSVSPGGAHAGQQVQLLVSQGHAPVQYGVKVYFNGVEAAVVGTAHFGPGPTGVINATVPALAPGTYNVQWSAGNFVSHDYNFTVR